MLFSDVLRNDWEINVSDYAKVVKMLRSRLSSLCDYLSVIYRNPRTDYRLAFCLQLASPSHNPWVLPTLVIMAQLECLPYTVNSETFARISFLPIALKEYLLH